MSGQVVHTACVEWASAAAAAGEERVWLRHSRERRVELQEHLKQTQYGEFAFTDAVRAAPGEAFLPREGYRLRVYRDRSLNLRLPMLSAAVSAERLFDAFLALLEPLGEEVRVVLDGSHSKPRSHHRNRIDAPVLKSYFCDYEDLLLNDGCTGVAVLSVEGPMEVQFCEHKLLSVYAPDLTPFRQALRSMGLRRRKLLPLVSEVEHLHHSTPEQEDEFETLRMKLGVADSDAVYSW